MIGSEIEDRGGSWKIINHIHSLKLSGMILVRSRFIMILFGLLLFSFLQLEGSDGAGDLQWIDLTSDHVDTDADGEDDDYLSYEVGDDLFVVDRLIDHETVMGSFTVLTLGSDPDNTALFGNTLDEAITSSNFVMMNIEIVGSTEIDGDQKEIYEIQSIRVYYTEGGSKDNDDDEDSDPFSVFTGALLFFGICCMPSIIATLISTFLRHQANKKKMEKIFYEGSVIQGVETEDLYNR
jgi:hypothetical protein